MATATIKIDWQNKYSEPKKGRRQEPVHQCNLRLHQTEQKAINELAKKLGVTAAQIYRMGYRVLLENPEVAEQLLAK